MKKTVLITGASSGIGAASARLFAQQGCNVIATLRTPQAGTALAAIDGVLVTRLDVQDRDSIQQAIESGIARFGKIDALVNNAGFGLFGVFEGTPRHKVQEQFDVNVFGVMDVVRAILPHFRANRGGLIINVSSGAGIFTLPMLSLYHASKFALEGFTESLAFELASQNIGIKLVEPGGVSTNFGQRSGDEYTQSASIADYDEFVAHTNAVFDGLRAARLSTAEEVAQAIHGAATDGTRTLRYVVGQDIAPLIKARRDMPDQDYVEFMRERFLPQK
jgi:NAD(P)-dependent dehydrogenase (short-subunit alcohol dehydrogenase family)